jgi:hypothetical protein
VRPGAAVRRELAPPLRFQAVPSTSAWGRPQPFARQVGTRPRSASSERGKAIRSHAGLVGDRRCSASIRVGLWRHRAQKLARSFPAGAAGVFGRQPGGFKRAARCRAARSLGNPAEAAKSAEMASFVRGMVARSVCPCSLTWLQKSASGVGPKKPFSVAAESGGQGLARRGQSAMGEGAS